VLCAVGPHRVVTGLLRCGLALPPYVLADEKPRRCLTAQVYRPTLVCGRGLWYLGDTEEARAAAFTPSYGELQRAASQQELSDHVKGGLLTYSPREACEAWGYRLPLKAMECGYSHDSQAL